jgi:peptidoglycan/xylan/chitin deacetylase (PgdA/CDA1 family)
VEHKEASRLRGLVKTGLAHALSWMRADRFIGSLADSRTLPVVVGYHRVVENFAAAARRAIPAMLTSRVMLEQQLDWIGRRFRFVTLDELGERLERGAHLGGLAAVTFDDGYRDVYEHAFPLLKRKGIPAAVFVVTDLVGAEELHVHDRLTLLLTRAFRRWSDPPRALESLLAELGIPQAAVERLDRIAGEPSLAVALLLRRLGRRDVELIMKALESQVGFDGTDATSMQSLTWEMLAEMQRGGFTIGSHTKTHAWLTQESMVTVVDEVEGARREIEHHLAVPVTHFAYPDGRFTTRTAAAVATAGYRFGYTTCMHRDARHPLLTIPRRMLWENSCLGANNRFSPAIMSCQLHGVFGLVRGCDQDHTA